MESRSDEAEAFLYVLSCGSSPEAWPIEVAWCFGEGGIRSMCLAPAGDWRLSAWDKGHEARHQLSLETILSAGKQPLEACLVLNAALGGAAVQTAAPETDSVWLFKLYQAAETRPNYRLKKASRLGLTSISRAADGVAALRSEIGRADNA